MRAQTLYTPEKNKPVSSAYYTIIYNYYCIGSNKPYYTYVYIIFICIYLAICWPLRYTRTWSRWTVRRIRRRGKRRRKPSEYYCITHYDIYCTSALRGSTLLGSTCTPPKIHNNSNSVTCSCPSEQNIIHDICI